MSDDYIMMANGPHTLEQIEANTMVILQVNPGDINALNKLALIGEIRRLRAMSEVNPDARAKQTIKDLTAARQVVNGCFAMMHSSQVGLPCCYSTRPVCLCHREAIDLCETRAIAVLGISPENVYALDKLTLIREIRRLRERLTDAEKANQIANIEQYDKFTAVVRTRRGERWDNIRKPLANEIEGKSYTFLAAYIIEEGIYEGEWAMVPEGISCPLAWIALGDLAELKKL